MIIDDREHATQTQDLSVFIKYAYRETLEAHHGWLGSQLFNVRNK